MNKKALSKALKTLEELQNIPRPKLYTVEYTDGTTEKLDDVEILLNAIRQRAYRETNPDYKAYKKIICRAGTAEAQNFQLAIDLVRRTGKPDPEIVEV